MSAQSIQNPRDPGHVVSKDRPSASLPLLDHTRRGQGKFQEGCTVEARVLFPCCQD